MATNAPGDNFKVSATGGAGSKDGQPKRYIPDMKSLGSTGTETMAQQDSAPLAETPSTPSIPNIRTLLSEDTNPMEPMSTGIDFGRGAGSEALPSTFRPGGRAIENKALINKYLPSLMAAAQSPDAPDTYKQFINSIISEIQ